MKSSRSQTQEVGKTKEIDKTKRDFAEVFPCPEYDPIKGTFEGDPVFIADAENYIFDTKTLITSFFNFPNRKLAGITKQSGKNLLLNFFGLPGPESSKRLLGFKIAILPLTVVWNIFKIIFGTIINTGKLIGEFIPKRLSSLIILAASKDKGLQADLGAEHSANTKAKIFFIKAGIAFFKYILGVAIGSITSPFAIVRKVHGWVIAAGKKNEKGEVSLARKFAAVAAAAIPTLLSITFYTFFLPALIKAGVGFAAQYLPSAFVNYVSAAYHALMQIPAVAKVAAFFTSVGQFFAGSLFQGAVSTFSSLVAGAASSVSVGLIAATATLVTVAATIGNYIDRLIDKAQAWLHRAVAKEVSIENLAPQSRITSSDRKSIEKGKNFVENSHLEKDISYGDEKPQAWHKNQVTIALPLCGVIQVSAENKWIKKLGFFQEKESAANKIEKNIILGYEEDSRPSQQSQQKI